MRPRGSFRNPACRPARHLGALLPAVALASAWVLGLAGCAKIPDPTWPAANELTVALSSSPINLDPRVGTDASSSRFFELAFEGLLGKDPHAELIPDLAESWEILDGGTRYRFHLRDGVRFHDGRPLTAADVVWTFRSLLDGTVATTKGAAFDRVESVEALDPRTVEFRLREPFGSFLVELTLGIVPDGATAEEMNRRPVGTGPFRFLRRTPETVALGRFGAYRRGAPPLERVILQEVPDVTVRVLELMKGSVQLVVNDLPPDLVPRFQQHPSYRVAVDPGAVYAYLGLNLEDPILADVRVRRAIAHGIDRRRLVATLWRGLGVVTETILPPGLWARNNHLEPYAYDPREARRLLDAAGWPDPDGDGPEPRFSLTYKTSTSETYLLQAQIIQQMLAEIGIAVTVRSNEFATFYDDVRRGNFQIFSLNRFGATDPNIYSLILHSRSLPPRGQNRGRYRNPEFDRLIDRAARLTDPAERLPLYLRAQEIFRDDLPYISLYTRSTVAVMPAIFEGYVNYPNGELTSLARAFWDRPGQRPVTR